MSARPVDHATRDRAIDPTASFAVQAPAGSGKTSLLTQRLLRLLTTVEAPEQIVAITFTRKAAAEMSARIMDALASVDAPPPADEHAQKTRALAAAVREHDARHGWDLSAQPARLRIMTIDALNQSLVRQMPLSAGMAGMTTIDDEPEQRYRDAARDALHGIRAGPELRRVITRALEHLDNDWNKLENLLAAMLGQRDQWLPLLAARDQRAVLVAAWERLVSRTLNELVDTLPAGLHATLGELAAWSGQHVDYSPLAAVDGLPGTTPHDIAAWQALAGLLLVERNGEAGWRLRVDKRQGFPADSELAKRMKSAFGKVVEALAGNERARSALATVRQLPAVAYDDREWTTISAMLDLLRQLAAHFMVAIQDSGRVDFTAIARAALDALGNDEAPTDLALSLDYQIRHLLVDEFQDTSTTQYQLITRLMAGWTPGDGRTVFVVGDPMQSIYRFRQAEVSLFRSVLDHSNLGGVPVEVLTLNENFRSQAGLVDWINSVMPGVLAATGEDSAHFVAQSAARPAADTALEVVPSDGFDAAAEAAEVVAITAAIRARDPDASIAVLVRGRAHLGDISGALSQAAIPVAAREIRRLGEVAVVADLVALTRALLHATDRIAWLAVLRAPWCGLTLPTLLAVAAETDDPADAIRALIERAALPADEHSRLARVAAVFAAAQVDAARLPLSDLVEQTWIRLGGPALTTSMQQYRDAASYLALLRLMEAEGALLTPERIEARMHNRFSAAPPAAGASGGAAVEIMTIHGAKGLEFDHVIIPGLGRPPRSQDRPLLLWRDEPRRDGGTDRLLATLPESGETGLYDYLHACARQETLAESSRLLYVALTRARERVYLLAHAAADKDGEPRAAKGSFARLLWDGIAEHFAAAGDAAPTAAARAAPVLTVDRADVTELPAPPAPVTRAEIPADPEADADDAVASAASPNPTGTHDDATSRYIGTITHRVLQQLTTVATDPAGPPQDGFAPTACAAYARGALRALGLPREVLDSAAQRVTDAVGATLASARGRWIFDSAHHHARAEFALVRNIAGSMERAVVDRTFIDSDDRRWIIDFKTASPGSADDPRWLDLQHAQYRAQLERYATYFRELEDRPIMLGLYFPLADAWREWVYPG